MKFQVIDLIVFIIITFGNVILGASFFFKNKTSKQFTSGGGKIPSWVVGMSIFAAFVSSISFLALPGKAYISNWNALVFKSPFHSNLTIVFGTIVIFLAGFIGMKLFSATKGKSI